MGDLSESSTSLFIRRHSVALSTTVNSAMKTLPRDGGDIKQNLARSLSPDPSRWDTMETNPQRARFDSGNRVAKRRAVRKTILRCLHQLAHAAPETRGYRHTCFGSSPPLWFSQRCLLQGLLHCERA